MWFWMKVVVDDFLKKSDNFISMLMKIYLTFKSDPGRIALVNGTELCPSDCDGIV